MGENENKSCTQHLYLKECQHFRKPLIKDRFNTTTKKKIQRTAQNLHQYPKSSSKLTNQN